ncbi:MAG TPA: glycosyltransferase family 39 protein [Anaerolineae bacterium]|nr:glycosyltransferase family 39 protein [Anaerolineae bacterium]
MTNDKVDYATRNMLHVSRVTRHSLLIILSTFVVLATLYSITTPIFEGPDEIWHYAFADHLANGGGLPVFEVNQSATFLRNGAHPPLYYWLVAAVIAPIDRSDFPAQFHFNLASPKITPGGQSDRPNLFIHTAHEDFPFHNTTLAVHLARLISIVLGVITIVGVWKVARQLLPDRDRLAIAATALAAFVPQFVYGSATVNNDALAAAATTWTVFALARLMEERSARWSILSGVLLGVTLLSKIGMVAILPLPLIGLLVSNNHEVSKSPSYKKNLRVFVSSWLKSIQWKQIVVSGFIIYIAAFAIAGWWYVRNWNLYGDPLAWKQWQALTGVGRVPPSIGDFMHDMIGLFGTFWADFSLRVDHTWVWVFSLLTLIAVAGLIRRMIRHAWPSIDWRGLVIALVWFGLLLSSAVRYSFSINDIHGRLLYPALAAIGVVLVLGLSGWNEIIGRRLIFGAIGGLIVVNAIVPVGLIQLAYAPPVVAALPNGVTKTSIKFDDIKLIGYRLKNEQIKSGESVAVATYWQSGGPITEPLPILHGITSLATRGGIIDRIDYTLGTDAYPRWAWRPNEIVETDFLLRTESSGTYVANVLLGVRGESAQLITSSAGDSINLGQVVVKDNRTCDVDHVSEVPFGGSIKLIGYRVYQKTMIGLPSSVILCWQSIKPTAIDYTVFVHVIDNQGGLITSDAQPLNGNYPTSAWVADDQIEDSHPLPAVIDLVIKRVSVGLYRLDTGERLTIDGTNETEFVLTTP